MAVFRSITEHLKAHPQRLEDTKWAARFASVIVVFAIFLYMMLLH